VAAEGAGGLPNRLTAFRKLHGGEGKPPFAVVPAPVDLGPGGQDAAAVVAAGEELANNSGGPVALVILDTLARCMGAGDENSARDMGSFIANCDIIRANLACTVLIVHHSGKATGAGMRGSSALWGAVDTVARVTKNATGHSVAVEKQKDGEIQKIEFALQVVDVGMHDGKPITSCAVQPGAGRTQHKLIGKYLQAFCILEETIANNPAQAPESVTKGAVTVAHLESWREALKEAGVTARITGANERNAFKRIREKLNEMGAICINDPYVWPAPYQA